AERARARQAQTDAPATAPRAKDQTQLATHPPAPPQAQLRSPREPKAEGAPLPRPKPPAAPPQAAQGRSCAGSHGAQQHPQAQLPTTPPPPRHRDAPPPPSHPLQNPQPALPIPHPPLRGTLERTHRRPRRPRLPQPLNQRRYRRRLKQAADRYFNIKARTD